MLFCRVICSSQNSSNKAISSRQIMKFTFSVVVSNFWFVLRFAHAYTNGFQFNSFLSRLNCILLAFQFELAFLCLAVTAVTAEFEFMPFSQHWFFFLFSFFTHSHLVRTEMSNAKANEKMLYGFFKWDIIMQNISCSYAGCQLKFFQLLSCHRAVDSIVVQCIEKY